MNDPTIVCPHCKKEIKLTESLAAPLVEATKRDFEKRMSAQEKELADREKNAEALMEEFRRKHNEMNSEIKKRVEAERTKLKQEAIDETIAENEVAIKERDNYIAQMKVKLSEAQKAQAELVRKERELDDAKREMTLTIEREVSSGLESARSKAKAEAEEGLKLRVREKEETISSMGRQIEELKKKAEQGSQQLQGEVQEVAIEESLKVSFPFDMFLPVGKGEHGGDIIQHVRNRAGVDVGTILWESKRTKAWSNTWLPKLRDDMRAAKAEVAILVSQVLPSGVEPFSADYIDGIWVIHPRLVKAMAFAMRQQLIEVDAAKVAGEGRETKMEMVYTYLTSTRFKQRVQAIVEAFSSMKEDLDKERKAITKQWAKREEQIERVMQSTAGMYGDLQGIAGKTLGEVEGLSVAALEAHD